MFKNLTWYGTHNLETSLLHESPKVSAPGTNNAVGDDADLESRDLAELDSEDEPEEVEESNEESEDELEESDEEDANGNKEDEEETEEETEDDKGNKKKVKTKKDETEEEEEDAPRASLYKKVKTKYPNLFKEFPEIRSAVFASDAFHKIFPTVEDAQDAAQTKENFDSISAIVTEGETDKFLAEVKGISDESYKRFVGNFLPALYGNDKDTYYAITLPVVRSALRMIVDRGTKKGGKLGGKEDNDGQNMINAAIVAHMEIFGDSDINTEDKPLVGKRETDPEREKFDREKKEYLASKYRDLMGSVESSVKNSLITEIEKELDPTNKLTSYEKKNLVRDIFQDIDKQLSSDQGHLRFVNGLWGKEEKLGFTGTHKEAIVKAVLQRAKALVSATRQRLRAEALRGKPKGNTQEKETHKQSERTPGNRSRQIPEKKTLKTGMSDLEFINS